MVKNKFSEKQLFALRQLDSTLSCAIEIQCLNDELKKARKFSERCKLDSVFNYIFALEKTISHLENARNHVLYAINSIDDKTLGQILYLRHVKDKTIIALSFKLHYSEKHISRLYRSALNALADTMGYVG